MINEWFIFCYDTIINRLTNFLVKWGGYKKLVSPIKRGRSASLERGKHIKENKKGISIHLDS